MPYKFLSHVFQSCFVSEIVPPTVEVCPRDMEFTSDKLITTVPKPNIVFRTHKKAVAPHLCSHFGKDSSCNFSFGIHLVYCRGFDPAFGELAVSSCQFKITIKRKYDIMNDNNEPNLHTLC